MKHCDYLIRFLDRNNRQKYTTDQLAFHCGVESTTIKTWFRSYIDPTDYQCEKIGATRLYFSVDYVAPEQTTKYIGAIVEPRTFVRDREYKPSRAMQAILERCDLSRTVISLASNVAPPQNFFVLTGGAFK